MKKLLSSGLAIGAMISLVGCGGGSSSSGTPMDTGYVVDTYVAGLDYTCSSGKTDKTTAEGQYSCNAGDTVQFSIGGFSLGGAVAASSGIVTPYTLWPESTATGGTAINVAQLLQSLDTNTSDDVITIGDIDLSGLNFEINSTNFDQDMDAALIERNVTGGLISNEEAQTHLDASEVLFFLVGKTFYLFDEGIESIEVSADGKSVTITDLVEGTKQSMSISIDGDTITAADGTTVTVDLANLIEGEPSQDRITVSVTEDEVTSDEIWYLDEEDRLREMLAGNTWVNNGFTITFDENVTSVHIVDGQEEFDDSVTLDGMTLTHSDGTDVIQILSNSTLLFNPGFDQETFTLVNP